MNKKLKNLLTDVKSFGAINKIETKGKQSEKIVLLGKHVQSRREVDDKLKKDVNTSRITGCAVMPNGSIAICDCDYRRLKLFDNSWVYKGSLSVPDISGVYVVAANTVIVRVPDQRKLQYVQILPQLQLGRTIQLDSICWGVCVHGDDIYGTCEIIRAS